MFQKILTSIQDLTRRYVLLVIVFASSSILILINYLTIKTLSAVRAYTNGESQYSKGQKDAARFLILYVSTGDAFFWNSFHKELAVPIGDSLARIAITHHAPEAVIRKGFQTGRNHPDDVANLIWLFENFHSVSFMKEAIAIWTKADAIVGEEYRLGESVHERMGSGLLPPDERDVVIDRINEITAELTRNEWAFTAVLGSTGRQIGTALFIVNIGMILIIMGSAGTYAFVMVRRLRKNNSDLIATNQELDRLVYSASHDLRAPITSLKGLIEIIKLENDPSQINTYLALMEHSLNKQDQFIRDIIDFSRNKRTTLERQDVSLVKMVDETIAQHRYMEEALSIKFVVDLQADHLRTDPQRLSIILSNLLSNAIKYSDREKADRKITVRSRSHPEFVTIEFEDNGIGIRGEHLEKIFDMFFVTQHAGKGTGLGLYITRETVGKLNGTIEVTSEFGKGTVFIVKLPV